MATTVINIRSLSQSQRALLAKRKLPDHVYIGRGASGPGVWGNLYTHIDSHSPGAIRVATRDEAISRHEADVRADPEMCTRIKRELKGKVLVCWCLPSRCHGETLAKIAEEK